MSFRVFSGYNSNPKKISCPFVLFVVKKQVVDGYSTLSKCLFKLFGISSDFFKSLDYFVGVVVCSKETALINPAAFFICDGLIVWQPAFWIFKCAAGHPFEVIGIQYFHVVYRLTISF